LGPPGGMGKLEAWKVSAAWQHEMGAPSGDGTTRLLYDAWRLAVCDACQAVWNQAPPSSVRCAPGSFGLVMVREEGFLHNFR